MAPEGHDVHIDCAMGPKKKIPLKPKTYAFSKGKILLVSGAGISSIFGGGVGIRLAGERSGKKADLSRVSYWEETPTMPHPGRGHLDVSKITPMNTFRRFLPGYKKAWEKGFWKRVAEGEAAGGRFQDPKTHEQRRLTSYALSKTQQAWEDARNAQNRGDLTKKPCQSCGTRENVEAHHSNYDHGTRVRWMCKSCHKKLELRKDHTMIIPHGDEVKKYGTIGLSIHFGENQDARTYSMSPERRAKIAKVMGEFKRGKLNSSSGQKVTNRKQAIAIALSEARGLSEGQVAKAYGLLGAATDFLRGAAQGTKILGKTAWKVGDATWRSPLGSLARKRPGFVVGSGIGGYGLWAYNRRRRDRNV